MRVLAATMLIAMAPLALAPGASGQELTVLERLERSEDLGVLSGQVPTFFSGGFENRAREIQRVLADATDFFSDSLGVDASLHLAVLDSVDWGAHSRSFPYGALWVSGGVPVAFVPATRDVPLARDYLSLRPEEGEPDWLAATQETFEGAALRMIDIIAFHEVGHTYHNALGIDRPARWFNEFMATYLAYSFLRAERPRLASIWNEMLHLKARSPRPAYVTLEQFEELYFGVGLENYNWYQAQFQVRAHEVFDALGLRFIELVGHEFPEAEATLDHSEILERLERVHPGFRTWATVFEVSR